MTLMLASVTSAAEAELALAHGADIVDLKDPAKGALGALDASVVRDVVGVIAGRRPTSAVLGDLPMEADVILGAAERMAATGVDYVKVGLFPGVGRADCIRALASIARRTPIVGVMFADRDSDLDLLPLMREAGFAGAMLDTAGKRAGRLLDHADAAALGQFIRTCRAHDLMTGLAGSLEAPDVPRLLLLAPDFLGFRGALCAAHRRTAGLDAAAFDIIRGLIPRERTHAGGHVAVHACDPRAAPGGTLMASGTQHLTERWHAAWPQALAAWSRYTHLHDPRLCASTLAAAKEGQRGSFAMIRLADQSVVIDLEAVRKYGLEDYAVEILAHEIGHHVLAPGNATDHMRMLARIRRGLPSLEEQRAGTPGDAGFADYLVTVGYSYTWMP